MTDPEAVSALQVLLIGLAVALSSVIKGIAARHALPALVGFLILGFGLRLADSAWGFMSEPIEAAFALLANLGIVALLFDVGLTSHPKALAEKLPVASFIWPSDMLVAFTAGFTAVYFLLGLDLLPALLVGTALTATSVGVSVATWQEAGAMDSDSGRLTLDVAELDDIGGIVLMAAVFALIPVLQGGGSLWVPLTTTLLSLIAKLAIFALLCYLFSRYLVEPLLDKAVRTESPPQLMVMVAGIGFIIAAVAGWIGFSLAIGALFAGLVFSHDPRAVRAERSFRDLYAFLTPFFFINIGYHVDPASLGGATQIGAVLLGAALLGKLLGVGLPAWKTAGASGAALIAVSMLPRAEIAMVVMHHARLLGEAVIPNRLYSGMVLVTAVTCLLTPLVLRFLLARPAKQEKSG